MLTSNRVGMELLWLTAIALGAGVGALARAEAPSDSVSSTVKRIAFDHVRMAEARLDTGSTIDSELKKALDQRAREKEMEDKGIAMPRRDLRDPMMGVPHPGEKKAPQPAAGSGAE